MHRPSLTPPIALIRRPLERAVVFALAWIVISDADPEGWMFGVAFVALATAASLKLTPVREWQVRIPGAIRFMGYFVHQSVAGGVDVARRVLSPSMPIDPDIVRYRMRLEPRQARVLFTDTVSLLPGTLSAGIDDSHITVHVLDRGLPIAESLAEVEERVADVYGIELPPAHHTLEQCALTEGGGS